MERKRSRDTDFADNTCMLDTFSIDFLLQIHGPKYSFNLLTTKLSIFSILYNMIFSQEIDKN